MVKYTELTVEDLRRALVSVGKFTEEEANAIKGKSKLIIEVESCGGLSLFDDEMHEIEDTPSNPNDEEIEFEDVDNDGPESYFTSEVPELVRTPVAELGREDSVSYNVRPKYGTDAWRKWILHQLQEDELYEGRPTLAGLRRLTEEHLGQIINSGPKSVKFKNGVAVVVYNVILAFGDDMAEPNAFLGSDFYREFSASADAGPHNMTHPVYCKYPVAIAESRAESRALRRALCINVVSAEEVSGDDVLSSGSPMGEMEVSAEFNADSKLSGAQSALITTKCKQMKIDVNKLINMFVGDVELSSLTREQAANLVKELTRYQSSAKGDESAAIPSTILVD